MTSRERTILGLRRIMCKVGFLMDVPIVFDRWYQSSLIYFLSRGKATYWECVTYSHWFLKAFFKWKLVLFTMITRKTSWKFGRTVLLYFWLLYTIDIGLTENWNFHQCTLMCNLHFFFVFKIILIWKVHWCMVILIQI